jgi:6-phosphofructo-2-kinase/fructose-2,6-biphosphatase 4
MDIPNLKFPRDEIIEIIPAAYQNEAKRIHIPGIDPKMTPGSPQDIRIPVPTSGPTSVPGSGTASGTLSPLPGGGLASPAEPVVVERPPEKVINTAAEMVKDKVDDED